MSIANNRSISETNDDGRFRRRSRSPPPPPPDNDDRNRQRTRSRSRDRRRGGGGENGDCNNSNSNTYTNSTNYRSSSRSGSSDKNRYNNRGGSEDYGNGNENDRKDNRDTYRRRSRSTSRSRSRSRRSRRRSESSDRGGNSRRPSEMNRSSNFRNGNFNDIPRGGESKVVAQAESKEIEPEGRIPDSSRDRATDSSSYINQTIASNSYPKSDYGLSGALGGGGGNDRNEINSDPASGNGIVQKQLPNFGVSGALAGDAETGNTKNGVILKYQEPEEAGIPSHQWRLYVFKDEGLLETLHISKLSGYLIGKDDRVCDILTPHPSISKQHAVIQFRKRNIPGSGTEVRPYVMDLGSTNKTFLNGDLLEDARYYELREKDCLKFGLSTREYILLHEGSSKSS